jgi:Fur family transcriptional regulator, peroxide stress response regulator
MTKDCDILDAKIKQRGMRMTRQRAVILEVLSQIKGHPRVEEIYQRVYRRMPHISFGTVYRSLKLLEELGFAQEIRFGKGYSRYECNPAPHQHFTCSACGNVMDVDEIMTCPITEVKVGGVSLDVKNFRLDFFGLCEKCR